MRRIRLQAIRDRQAVNRMWMDQIGVWSYEAPGLKPPTLDGRFNWPAAPLELTAYASG